MVARVGGWVKVAMPGEYMDLRKKAFFAFLVLTFFQLNAATPEPATVSAQNEMWKRWEKLVSDSENRTRTLDLTERKRLLKIVSENPVATSSALSIYDPPQNGQPTGEIGFCYGRAMAAHLIARKMGLDESSMQKIFAAGDMQNGSVRWRFHMATLVRGEDGKDYAIDPIIPSMVRRYNAANGTALDPLAPVTPQMWATLIQANYDNTAKILAINPDLKHNPKFTGTIKFYLSDTQTMMVDMREVPATLDVESGERIIEILFDPSSKSGFTPRYFSAADETARKVGFYTVDTLDARRRFFMVKDEPLTEQFNFFQIAVDIFFVKDDVLGTSRRFYLYNGIPQGETEFQHYSKGYFPALFTSIEGMTERFNKEVLP